MISGGIEVTQFAQIPLILEAKFGEDSYQSSVWDIKKIRN